MQTKSNNVVLLALLTALRPLARILMKVGIGYREFSEIAKCAFVDVSTNEFGLRGRPTNISRVAVMTGLTRKEVKRIRVKIDDGRVSEVSKSTPYVAILGRWHEDSDYIDSDGRPLALPFDGASPSFAELVKKYGGDIPPGAMRTELKRVKAIDEDLDGKLHVQMRVFRPFDAEQRVEICLGQALASMTETLSHNFDRQLDQGHIQRQAFATGIRQNDMARVRRISRDRVAEFIESVDDLYSAYSTIYGEDANESDDGSVVGVGAYYFELDRKTGRFFAEHI